MFKVICQWGPDRGAVFRYHCEDEALDVARSWLQRTRIDLTVRVVDSFSGLPIWSGGREGDMISQTTCKSASDKPNAGIFST
jgi:hypothetical protein